MFKSCTPSSASSYTSFQPEGCTGPAGISADSGAGAAAGVAALEATVLAGVASSAPLSAFCRCAAVASQCNFTRRWTSACAHQIADTENGLTAEREIH